MNRLKKIALKTAVLCAGLLVIWQTIAVLPPVKNIHLPGGSGLSMDRVLETFFLTLIALAIWFRSRDIAPELEPVFSKVPLLSLFWENIRLFVFLFFLYRAYVDFIPLLLGARLSFFTFGFFMVMLFPVARMAWHGYRHLDLLSDADTWARLADAVRKCAKCGSLNAAEAAYCRRCGAALFNLSAKTTRCVCGADVPASDSFCVRCGRPPSAGDPVVPPPPAKKAASACPNCSAPASPGQPFCGRCGAKIAA